MRLLLDTHTFLWWNVDDDRLSQSARALITDPANQVLISAASAWEMAIKSARGRLTLPMPVRRYVSTRVASQGFEVLPINLSHALAVAELPEFHADPFDRLLVAQSQLEDIPLVTADRWIGRYEVRILW